MTDHITIGDERITSTTSEKTAGEKAYNNFFNELYNASAYPERTREASTRNSRTNSMVNSLSDLLPNLHIEKTPDLTSGHSAEHNQRGTVPNRIKDTSFEYENGNRCPVPNRIPDISRQVENGDRSPVPNKVPDISRQVEDGDRSPIPSQVPDISRQVENGSRSPVPADAPETNQERDGNRKARADKAHEDEKEDFDKATMKEATEAAKEKLDEGLKMLKAGDYAGLQKLAQQLRAKNEYGAFALAQELSRVTGMSFNFQKNSMSITIPDGPIDPNACDQIRSGITVQIQDGKVADAYAYKYGGYMGMHQEVPIDTGAAEKQLTQALLRVKR